MLVTATRSEADTASVIPYPANVVGLLPPVTLPFASTVTFVYEPAAKKQLARIESMGFGKFPVCMAKNQYSLSDDAKLLGRPENFDIHIREVYVNAGAGFVVALTGAIMTMPGLPKVPAANGIDVEDGKITGLF